MAEENLSGLEGYIWRVYIPPECKDKRNYPVYKQSDWEKFFGVKSEYKDPDKNVLSYMTWIFKSGNILTPQNPDVDKGFHVKVIKKSLAFDFKVETLFDGIQKRKGILKLTYQGWSQYMPSATGILLKAKLPRSISFNYIKEEKD